MGRLSSRHAPAPPASPMVSIRRLIAAAVLATCCSAAAITVASAAGLSLNLGLGIRLGLPSLGGGIPTLPPVGIPTLPPLAPSAIPTLPGASATPSLCVTKRTRAARFAHHRAEPWQWHRDDDRTRRAQGTARDALGGPLYRYNDRGRARRGVSGALYPQSATAGSNSPPRGRGVGSAPSASALTIGSYAARVCEPRQVRKEAAVSGPPGVP